MPTLSTNTNNDFVDQLAGLLKDGQAEDAWIAIDRCIAWINERVEEALNHVLHHKHFQSLERMWLGLAKLIDAVGDLPMVKLEMLDCSKEDLLDDFEQFMDLSDSGLFQHMYKTEYDQAGGEPYASVLFHHHFDHRTVDVHLLRLISKVAASCHCPAIFNVPFSIFGARDARQFENIEDLELIFQRPEYQKWQSLRTSEDARYLGAILPQFLARPPYIRRVSLGLVFNENVRDNWDYCWAPSTFLFGILLAKSFVKHGWCVHIRGPHTGGLVESIKPFKWAIPGLDFLQAPTTVTISDKQEHMLAQNGFMFLNYYRDSERLCLFSAPTLQIPGTGQVATQNDRLSASLPYVFLVSRIAHYQKVIQRENIGTVKEPQHIQNELSAWLKKLITLMPDPSLDIRSRYPLRGGSVNVMEDPSNPGFFNVRMVLQPHLQLEGVNAELTLLSKLPRKKE